MPRHPQTTIGMSAAPAPAQTRVRGKRTSKACERCRSMKVKCSGTQPCARCGRKRRNCIYPARERRISIPESYLQELRNRNETKPRPATGDGFTLDIDPQLQSELDQFSPQSLQEGIGNDALRCRSQEPFGNELPVLEEDPEISKFRQNPLVDNDYVFRQAGGKNLYMGPSSSWSFCRRVLALLGRRIPTPRCGEDPFHLDGTAFRLKWRPLGYDDTPDTSHIPPLDFSLLLVNTVKFYFGHLFYLVDEPEFIRELHEFYENPVAKAQKSRLWYAQFLLVLAFGKAFRGGAGTNHSPPGHQYAARAMGLLPDFTGIDADGVQSAQTLALAALYLQSVDMRTAAFQLIGQALRFCIVEGMHRHMPEESVGAEYSQRCGILFWVVYMLDREFAALIGSPASIRDEDISAKLPTQMSQGRDASNMTLHIQLSTLMSRILTSVYGVGENFDGSLVTNTQSILRNLAHISQDLSSVLNTHFQGSVNKASRMVLRLVLSYHHCVVLTTRPLVMCALHMHIEQTDSQVSHHMELTPTVASLIQSCVDSAQTTLRTLRASGDEDILESFLPFQLEDAFSSAFILQLVHAILPSLLPDDSWRSNIHCVLDKMISQGSLVAPLRKVELGQLEDLLGSLTPSSRHSLTPPEVPQELPMGSGLGDASEEMDSGWDLFMEDGMMGMSPRELLELAEQLDAEGFGAPQLEDDPLSMV